MRGGVPLLSVIAELINFLKPKIILDYGCGKGGLVKALAEKFPNIQVYGYDPAVEEFSKMPIEKADLVVSTDVLEHIPADELPETVQRIAAISQNVFFHLHHAKAGAILPNGENAHCTIWTPQKYAVLFSQYFKVIGFLPGYDPAVNTSCITFNLPDEIKNCWEFLIRGNKINYVDDLETFLKLIYSYKENIIFPAQGWDGANAVLDYLKYSKNINQICCLAAEFVLNDFEEKFICNLPVLPIKFLPHFRESAAFFAIIPKQYHEAAQAFLKNFGFKTVFFIGENLINQCQNAIKDFINSGGMLMQFMDDVTKKLHDLEFRIAEQREVCETNTAAFAEYRNCFRGKKVVIVGSGPSAKYYKPIPNAIHIALNFAWRREDISFDYLFTGDNGVNRHSEIKMQQGFERIKDKIFISKHLSRSPHRHFDFGEDISSINNVRRFYFEYGSDRNPIYQNIALHPLFGLATIAAAAVDFALFTYPQELYLVGCDTASNGYFYENPNLNHSVGNKNMNTHRMKVGYTRIKMFAKHYYPDTRIISVNPVGLRGLFEDIYTEDFLKK